MRKIDARLIPRNAVALLTVPELSDSARAMMADFRDSFVLLHRASGRLVGVSADRGVLLARRPPFMSEGVWCAAVDDVAVRDFPDLVLSSSDVSLVPVE